MRGAWIIGDARHASPSPRPPLARAGENVTIHGTKVLTPGTVSVGSQVIIDDFVFIGRHKSLVLGSHAHIASHASINGGGSCVIGDYGGGSSGARIPSGSDDPHGSKEEAT